MELVDADAIPFTARGGGVVVDDPDKKIEGELADDESNKRTGPKSRRKHRLGVRKEAGTEEARSMLNDNPKISPENSDETEREWAAIRVQSVYRGHLGRNTFFMMLGNDVFISEQREEAALCIQCAFRCSKARNEYYDLLGGADGLERTPSYETSRLPEAILDKYLQAIEDNSHFAESAMLKALVAAKSMGHAGSAVEKGNKKIQLLVEENAELEKKLAEANEFLKNMNAGGNTTLEVQTLKIQLELKDEEIEDMQQSLDEKRMELAQLREDARVAKSRDEAGIDLTQRIEAPLDLAQASCQELEGTLGTLVEAVSTALDSRHKADMEVGSLQAHAVSLQNKNEVFFFENQELRSELAALRNEHHKATFLVAHLSTQMLETSKIVSAAKLGLRDLETSNQETLKNLVAAESDMKDAEVRIQNLREEKVCLEEKLSDVAQSRERETSSLRQELAASQQALMIAQTSADALEQQVRQSSSWQETELLNIQAKEKDLQQTVCSLQSEKVAVDQANAELTEQLQQARHEVDIAQQELASHGRQVKELQQKLEESTKLAQVGKAEVEALQLQWKSQDDIQGRSMDSILLQFDSLLPVVLTLQSQYNHSHLSLLDKTLALIQTWNEVSGDLRGISEQWDLDAAAFEVLETRKNELEHDLASANCRIATAHDELATQARSADDARELSAALEQMQVEKENALMQVQELESEKDALKKISGLASLNLTPSELASLTSSQDLIRGMQESLYQAQEATANVEKEKTQLLEEMMLANEQVTTMLSNIEHGETMQMRTEAELRIAFERLLEERDYLAMACRQHKTDASAGSEFEDAQNMIEKILHEMTCLGETVERATMSYGESTKKFEMQFQKQEEDLAKARADLHDSQAEAQVAGSRLQVELEELRVQHIVEEILHEMTCLGETVERATMSYRESTKKFEMQFRKQEEDLAKARADLHDSQAEAQVAGSRLQVELEELRRFRDKDVASEDTAKTLEVQMQMNIEMKKSIDSQHETIRRLGLEIEKLKSQNSKHLSQVSALEQDRDSLKRELLEAISHGMGMAAIGTARYDLMVEQCGGNESEPVALERENSNDHPVRRGEGVEMEYSIAIDGLCKLGVGVDAAVYQALQTCGALVQRVDTLKERHEVREHELQAEIEHLRDHERGREQQREEERKEEREKARERVQERQREHEEREKLRQHGEEFEKHRILHKEAREMDREVSVTDNFDKEQVKQLEALLEQKERLLVSQSATVSALETAVDALKGQVQSVSSEKQTVVHEKDGIIAQLQRELTEWPGRHLLSSPNAQSFVPHVRSAVRDEQIPSNSDNLNISTSYGGAGLKNSQDRIGREDSPGQLARTSLRDGMMDDESGTGTLPAAPWQTGETSEQYVQSSYWNQNRTDYALAKGDIPSMSEGDRAGTNPLSFSPYSRSINVAESSDGGKGIFQGGFGDRGTASLSRRLRSLTDYTADARSVITEGNQEQSFAPNSSAVPAFEIEGRFWSSPQGVRSYGTPEVRASKDGKYLEYADVQPETRQAAHHMPAETLESGAGIESQRGGALEMHSNSGSQAMQIRPTTAHWTREQRSLHEDVHTAFPDQPSPETGASLTSRSTGSVASVRRKQPLTPVSKILFSERTKVASPATNHLSRVEIASSNSRHVACDEDGREGILGRGSVKASVPRKLRSTVIANRGNVLAEVDPYETDDFGSARVRTYQRPADVEVWKKPTATATNRPTTARHSAERRRIERRIAGGHADGLAEDEYHVQRQAFESELFRVLPVPSATADDSD